MFEKSSLVFGLLSCGSGESSNVYVLLFSKLIFSLKILDSLILVYDPWETRLPINVLPFSISL